MVKRKRKKRVALAADRINMSIRLAKLKWLPAGQIQVDIADVTVLLIELDRLEKAWYKAAITDHV